MSAHIASWGDNIKGELGAGYFGSPVLKPVLGVELGSDVLTMQAAGMSSYIQRANRTLVGCGGDTEGQLCNGVYDEKVIVPVVSKMGVVAKFAAGGAHLIALFDDGAVATCGGSMVGQLGNGQTAHGSENHAKEHSAVPVRLTLPLKVVDVAASGGNTGVVFEDGTMALWGENHKGQIGDGTTLEKPYPTLVSIPGKKVVKLSLGGVTTLPGVALALCDDGTVCAWGAGEAGQLGTGKPIVGKANDRLIPAQVEGLSDVADVYAGNQACFVRLSNGDLLGCGRNFHFQLGIPVPEGTIVPGFTKVLANVSAFSPGYMFAAAVINGDALVWGKNTYGMLGDGTTIDKPLPTRVLANVVAVACAETHMLALVTGPLPAPPVTLKPGPASLTAAWKSPPTGTKWLLGVRKEVPDRRKGKAEPWTRVFISPSARSYSFSGLTPGTNYEVVVQNASWGRRVLEGKAL